MPDFSTDEFDYELPEALIGQVPTEPRDAARLLDARDAAPVHRHVRDLPDLLQPGDLLVVNDTKVLPARFHLVKPTGGAVEVLLLEPTGRHLEWRALVKPGKRLHVGTTLSTPPTANRSSRDVLTIVDQLDDGRRVVELIDHEVLDELGTVPLPPYITAPLGDPDRYQTVYAQEPGSVAAPTAGLHLTDTVLDRLAERGVGLARVELRVGLGTFRPITTDSVLDHDMHAERYRIEPAVWDQIRSAKRVIAVGTTTVRTLESAASTGQLEGETRLFIHRGFDWKVVDLLMTNFHVPRSSLLVMIDAFVGPRWRQLYEDAVHEQYRFLSFGDAMLLQRMPNEASEGFGHAP